MNLFACGDEAWSFRYSAQMSSVKEFVRMHVELAKLQHKLARFAAQRSLIAYHEDLASRLLAEAERLEHPNQLEYCGGPTDEFPERVRKFED